MSMWDPNDPFDRDWLSEIGGRDADEEYVRVFEHQDGRYGRVRQWFKNIGPRYNGWRYEHWLHGDFEDLEHWLFKLLIRPAFIVSVYAFVLFMVTSYNQRLIGFNKVCLVLAIVCAGLTLSRRLVVWMVRKLVASYGFHYVNRSDDEALSEGYDDSSWFDN